MILTNLTILIIGASHLAKPGYLITSLHDELQNQGAKVHTIGVCGVEPSEWLIVTKGLCGGAEREFTKPINIRLGKSAETQPISDLIAKDNPDVVVIIMGDTLGKYKEQMVKFKVYSEASGLAKKIASLNKPCLWVGPPWGNELQITGKTHNRTKELNYVLSNSVAPCKYVDSLSMSKPDEWLTTDGQHFTPDYYKEWSKKIVENFKMISDLKF